MAKIVQSLTQPNQDYDVITARSLVRDIDGIVQKLNTTFQQDLKDEVEAQYFFLNYWLIPLLIKKQI